MPHDLDREFFDVRVFASEQTAGDDAVAACNEATPCGCTFFDGPVFGFVNDIIVDSVCRSFKVLRLVNISGKLF